MGKWKETEIGRIPEHWGLATLEGISSLITDGSHKSPKPEDSTFLMPSVKDMTYDRFDFTNCKTIAEKDFLELLRSNCSPRKGDIIISKDGANCLDLIFVYNQEEQVVLLSSLAIVRLKESYSPEFFRYFMLSPNAQFHMRNNLVSGSAIPRVVLKDFKNVPVPTPTYEEQRAIASVLSSLDAKIDLLHRQNKTLEAMAETLFRQWFVEEADEGWEEGTLDQILSVKGGTTPSTKNPEFWDGDIHWTTPRDLSSSADLFLFDTARRITERGLAEIGSGLLPSGTLLMSSRAPVGYLAFADMPVAVNQGYIAIIDDKGIGKHFIYLWLKANMDLVHSYANGSTFQEISKAAFKTLELTIPPNQRVADFEKVVQPLFLKIRANLLQVRKLTALRDTLLPKLMSGEVRVAEINNV